MIELQEDELVFSFPEAHRDAELRITFKRTLRIPDDGKAYPLPPGLSRFPLRHVDDYAERVPEKWLRRGGVMLPMYQSEAMWINFRSPHGYPFAVKVATGKVNAVTGKEWSDTLKPNPQDYMSVPPQPWLDGYCVSKGVIRQFVAMPLGSGYTVEEQLTGEAEHGGVQILVHPLRAEFYRPPRMYALREGTYASAMPSAASFRPNRSYDMGLAPGGKMRQEIYTDRHDFAEWDQAHRGRCFVHLTNSLGWRAITGQDPPTVPPTAKEYTRAGLPWFDFYGADQQTLDGGTPFEKVRSVKELGVAKGDVPLPENETVDPKLVVRLRAGLAPDEVREGAF